MRTSEPRHERLRQGRARLDPRRAHGGAGLVGDAHAGQHSRRRKHELAEVQDALADRRRGQRADFRVIRAREREAPGNRERLELAFGTNGALAVDAAPDRYTVTIVFPADGVRTYS